MSPSTKAIAAVAATREASTKAGKEYETAYLAATAAGVHERPDVIVALRDLSSEVEAAQAEARDAELHPEFAELRLAAAASCARFSAKLRAKVESLAGAAPATPPREATGAPLPSRTDHGPPPPLEPIVDPEARIRDRVAELERREQRAAGLADAEVESYRTYALQTGRDPDEYMREVTARPAPPPAGVDPVVLASYRNYALQTGRDPDQYIAELVAEGVL